MARTITQLDLKRSIVWEHEHSSDKQTCEILTRLYIWMVDGQIYKIADAEVTLQLKKIITNMNKNREVSRAITKAEVVKRDRVDDLIY